MRLPITTFIIICPVLAFASLSNGTETSTIPFETDQTDLNSPVSDQTESISPESDQSESISLEIIENQPNNQWSPARIHQLAILKGKDLPMLLGKSVDNYSVMAITDGELSPIPFQFDDIDTKGFPYVPNGHVPLKGVEKVFEDFDELVFMLKDTGEKASIEQLENVEGTLVAMLDVSDDTVTRFVYILEGNTFRSEKSYTHYNKKTGLIKSDFYSLQTRKKNILDWSDLIYYSYSKDQSILDTMKIRIRARFGPFKANLHNKIIPNKVVAVKNGPVRSLVSINLSLSLLGINFADAGALGIFSANGMSIPVFAHIPSITHNLSELTIDFSLDFNDIKEFKVMSALGPQEPIIVGDYQNTDPDMLQVSLKHNWITASSDAGLDLISFFTYSDFFKPKLGLLFKDIDKGDGADGPERYSGSKPQIGYILKDIPSGKDIQFGLDIHFGNEFWQYGAGKSVNEFLNPVTISAFTLDQTLAE